MSNSVEVPKVDPKALIRTIVDEVEAALWPKEDERKQVRDWLNSVRLEVTKAGGERPILKGRPVLEPPPCVVANEQFRLFVQQAINPVATMFMDVVGKSKRATVELYSDPKLFVAAVNATISGEVETDMSFARAVYAYMVDMSNK